MIFTFRIFCQFEYHHKPISWDLRLDTDRLKFAPGLLSCFMINLFWLCFRYQPHPYFHKDNTGNLKNWNYEFPITILHLNINYNDTRRNILISYTYPSPQWNNFLTKRFHVTSQMHLFVKSLWARCTRKCPLLKSSKPIQFFFLQPVRQIHR